MFFKKHIFFAILFLKFSLSFSQNIAPVASNVSAATVKNINASIHLVASDSNYDNLTYSIVSVSYTHLTLPTRNCV